MYSLADPLFFSSTNSTYQAMAFALRVWPLAYVSLAPHIFGQLKLYPHTRIFASPVQRSVAGIEEISSVRVA